VIYVGYDPREHLAAEVCRWSILRYCADTQARLLRLSDADVAAVYHRPFHREESQLIDGVTGAPFSTQFSFSRFLVPYLASYRGWHLFVDADFLFRASVADLFALADKRYAAMVVKHAHRPCETVKMDGVAQTAYARKNWSSLVLWNAAHPANARLTPHYVARASGLDLHGFRWLDDGEIGALPLEWNYLVGHNTAEQCAEPKAVHFTLGGPWFGGAYGEVDFADDWRAASTAYVAA